LISIPADRRTLVGQLCLAGEKTVPKEPCLRKGFNRVRLIEAEKSESNLSITERRRVLGLQPWHGISSF